MILEPPTHPKATNEEDLALFALGELRGPKAWLIAIRAAFNPKVEQRLKDFGDLSHRLSLGVRGRPRRVVQPWIPVVRAAKWAVLVTAVLVTGVFVAYQAAQHLQEPYSGEPVRDGSGSDLPHGAPAAPPADAPSKVPADQATTAAMSPTACGPGAPPGGGVKVVAVNTLP